MATQTNIPILHRKEWQMMTPAPVTTGAAMFMVAPGSGHRDVSMYVTSATVQYIYSHDEDGFTQIPSAALAGTFGAGACGAYSPWSITFTANGGSTTTVTVAAATHNITGSAVGKTIEFISAGTATGQRRTITNVDNQAGAGTITITFDYAVNTAILNTHTFRIANGSFFLMSAGTTAAGSWKRFDKTTLAWQASLSTTNLPASWATDGRAVSTARHATVLANGTASSGSTTTIVDTSKAWTVDAYANRWVMIVDGTGEGQMVKITSNTATTLTFPAITTGADATSVYQITDGKPGYAIGVATSGSTTTVVNSGKAWTSNQWTNYQVRILSGTGAGQIRNISSNTGTTLTIPAGATIDTTSVYIIESNEDNIYLLGNNAVTMYKYVISTNAWSVMSPTVARGAAPSTGMCADWIGISENSTWASETVIQDGRYIYSMRGGAGALIDRFDIAGGTAGAGAWTAVTYIGTETFTTGSSAFQSGEWLYIRKDATNRFFKYSVVKNVMFPFNTNTYTDGVAVLGQKIWVKSLDSTENVRWVYSLQNTGTALHRIMII
jgi:hypothetical protein